MKLFVIVLCLLSERYLIHSLSTRRFNWFPSWFHKVSQRLSKPGATSHALLIMAAVMLPIVVLVWLAFYLFGNLLFGLPALLLNLFVLYYCLGPDNPFYPMRDQNSDANDEAQSGSYFSRVNGQLFAPIFWFVVCGAVGVLIYRLMTLLKDQEITRSVADKAVNLLDWVTARITLMMYMLAGNFNQVFSYYRQMFFSAPENNTMLLSSGGLMAAQTHGTETVSLSRTQNLVEVALVIYLVFIALFTLAAWM